MSDQLTVLAPISGRVVPLTDVPDPVFAGAMVGPGVAIDPDRVAGVATAPVAGKIAVLHPHAFVVMTASGRGVLVHLGIDTVQLKGEGFRLLAGLDDDVVAGTPIVEWDPAAVQEGGRSPICPIVALDAGAAAIRALATGSHVEAGADLYAWD